MAEARETDALLPNLIVIGAERCGTTSLHGYLASHPEVFMSRQKELDFFVADRNWRRGRSWYERQFPLDAPVRGESSPAYTAFPISPGVPARAASLVPDAKLLYLVRDPVDRTISALHLARALGLERRSASAALRDLDTSSYVVRSRYATQLEQYFEHFPRDATRVVDAHELRARRRDTLTEIFEFLGIATDVWTPVMDSEVNSGKRRARNVAGRRLWALGRRTIGDPRTRAIMRKAPAWVSAPLTRPTEPTLVDEALRGELESLLAGEATRLRALTGLGFATWSV